MQRRGGMEHSNHKAIFHFSHLPMDLCDLGTFEKQTHGETPEGHDDAGIDNLDLVLKIIAGTDLHFIWQRVAVARRSALDYIGDPHVCACLLYTSPSPRD